MTKKILANTVIAILVAMFHSGCEMNLGQYGDPNAKYLAQQKQDEVAANPQTNPTTNPTTNPSTDGRDQLNISGAVIYRGDDPAGARVTRSLNSADKQGGSVGLSFSTLNWPSQGSGKKIDGGVYIFWNDGGHVVGGSFDWHGVGQTGKTLANIGGGILDGHVPPSGASIWFCIVSLDGSQRTNVAKSPTNW